MCIRSFTILFCTYSVVLLRFCVYSLCDSTDRKYNCECVFDYTNGTDLFAENYKQNTSSNRFIPALKSLQSCRGSFQCKPNFIPDQPLTTLTTDYYIICFNDDSCISNGGSKEAPFEELNDVCVKKPCMYLKDLIELNISNPVLEVDAYKCINGSKDLEVSYCLKPACKSFVAVEKWCACNYATQSCRCSSYCQSSSNSAPLQTYALFLSFGDIYQSKGNTHTFLHWIILIVLCFGLIILLIIFCRLCRVIISPVYRNEVQNNVVLRAAPPQTSTDVKCNYPTVEQSSPPPSYEQVLKDKCIEFKKSIA